MIDPTRNWIVAGSDFYDIKNPADVLQITWTNNIYDDFVAMSESYYLCAHATLSEIVNSSHDNAKNDMWFLPGMYMYRQAIELLCKALIIPILNNKNQIIGAFTQYKHNIESLFSQHILPSAINRLASEEAKWVADYLLHLEYIDSKSDLFRYPFRDEFLSNYSKDYLDVVDMANGFEQCYSILFKCVGPEHNPLKYQTDIDCTMSTDFLRFSSYGIGNCDLYESPWDNGFYKQIEGYSNVAAYIFSKSDVMPQKQRFFPVVFLLRNAIELSLKRILITKTEIRASDGIRRGKKNSHFLYKDLWIHVKPVIEHYSKASQEDLSQIVIAEEYIKKINAIDKKGDVFRYPVDYGLQYRFTNQKVDFNNVHSWMQGIFNFLDGCDDMLSAIYDHECEMRNYYY